MKIAIIGDTHFGLKGNNENTLSVMYHYTKKVFIPYLKENNIKTVIHMGDVYDNRTNINVMVENHVSDIFKELNEIAKIHVLVGNHDLYYRNNNNIFSTRNLENENVTLYDDITNIKIDNKNILLIPWMSNDEMYKKFLDEIKKGCDYAFGHLEINGFKMNSFKTEEHGIPRDVFKNVKNSTFSGHFHLRDMENKIKYVGTPYEMDWNDYLNDKGFHILDLETNDITFVENKTSPKHIKINSSDFEKRKEEIKNNYVQLIFDDDSDRNKITKEMESLNPLTNSVKELELENIIQENEGFNIENLSNVRGFTSEYIDNLTVQDNINKDTLNKYLDEIYIKIKQ